MSLQPDGADSDPGRIAPPSALLKESVTEVLGHLDGVIDQATSAQRHSRLMNDDKIFHALDDAISLLQHVRSRLRYDTAPESGPDLGPTD